jgi:hypothetical protein
MGKEKKKVIVIESGKPSYEAPKIEDKKYVILHRSN